MMFTFIWWVPDFIYRLLLCFNLNFLGIKVMNVENGWLSFYISKEIFGICIFLLTCNSTFIDYTKCTEKSNKFQTYQHQTYLYSVVCTFMWSSCCCLAIIKWAAKGSLRGANTRIRLWTVCIKDCIVVKKELLYNSK